MELYKQFKLACMIVSKCFIKIRSSLLEFDECRIEVDDGSELRRFILLYKLDDILFKMFSHLRCLTKTIGYYVEEKGQVFFPGKVNNKKPLSHVIDEKSEKFFYKKLSS